MSKSRLVNKDFGRITLNDNVLNAKYNELLLNDNIVGEYILGTIGNVVNSLTIAAANRTNVLENLSNISIFNTLGGGGAIVNIDLSTYDYIYPNIQPSSRITLVDDGQYSSSFSIMTKIPGNASNSLKSRLYVQSYGNIGINTTNPNSVLDVNGTILTTKILPSYHTTTQTTSINTDVTNNSQFGSIITVSSNLASQQKTSFNVYNNVLSGSGQSKIISSISNYTGTTGLPSIFVKPNTTYFTITIINNSTTESLNGVLEISFGIINL